MEEENTANDTSAHIFTSLDPIMVDRDINSIPELAVLLPATPITIIPAVSENWGDFSTPPPSPEQLRPSDAILASIGGIALSGRNLKPHIIHIYRGQDVVEKVISFCKAGHPVAIILSASAEATIASATLHGSNAAGKVVLEGRFDILSLTGRFIASEYESADDDGVIGGLLLTISMVLQDMKIIGGTVAGPLVAASRMHVVLGTFDPILYDQQADVLPMQTISNIIETSSSCKDSC